MPLAFEDLKKGMHVRLLCKCEGFIHALNKKSLKSLTILYTAHCDHILDEPNSMGKYLLDRNITAYERLYMTVNTALTNIFIGKFLVNIFPMEETAVPPWWPAVAMINTAIQQLDTGGAENE